MASSSPAGNGDILRLAFIIDAFDCEIIA
jgi:putative transposase